ncbi:MULTISPECIES: WXG100 family type VII secretion target [unclassified Streptomyces]|uniref:WXG100 family type VII secretion target n=1 Tax=unclassified Streptomyces TaxID=2593676 RepID=UPI0018E45EAB|nr:WXG100 family type VII secretion target [Streptomyces sp. DH-12]
MDFSDGYIYVDYDRAEGSAEDMIIQSQAIMNILENLEMELTELRKTWVGDDKDVYDTVQAAWNGAVENIRNLLANHSGLLTEISANYRSTEQNLSQRWSDIRIGGR